MTCKVTVKDSYRQVIKGFFRAISVQLVQKKMDRNARLRVNLDLPQLVT